MLASCSICKLLEKASRRFRGAMLEQGSLRLPALKPDWRQLETLSQVEINATPPRLSSFDFEFDDQLPEEPPLDPLLEPLLDEPPLDDPPPGPLLDEPLPEASLPDEPPVPNELPVDPLLDGLVEDPPEDDFSLDGLRPDEEAPLPDELLSLLDEAPLDEEPFPLPAASTPSALAVLSSRRPVACIPLSF